MALVGIDFTGTVGSTISDSHFGGNYLFNRELFDEGVGDTGGYDEVVSKLNVLHLRYPGGGMAERYFNLSNPENEYQDTDLTTGETVNNSQKLEITPLSEFLEYAQEIDGKVSIVLPTNQYKDAIIDGDENETQLAKEEIQGFVDYVLNGEFGNTVEIFELGNEYYAAGDMLPVEYGQVANKMAIWVQEAIEISGSGFDPIIGVQSSQKYFVDNSSIIQEFSAEGLSAIDAVIAHTYQNTPWESSNIDEKASLVELWNQAVGEGADLKWIVSEWNVTQNSVDGLNQGASILEMFHQLVGEGMDIGYIWPLLENTETELAGNVTLGEPTDLLIAGETFRQMSESLDGLQAVNVSSSLDIDGDAEIDALIHLYTNTTSDKMVVFLSSLEGNVLEIDLDLSNFGDITTNYDHLWATQIAQLDGQNPLSPNSLPKVTTLTSSDLEGSFLNDGIVSLSLDPYNIARLEFTIGEGVTMMAHDQTSQNDFILGSEFADTIFGYAGNDILKGGRGDDHIISESGTNAIHGHGGDDVLEGGVERDRLLGGGGNDHLYGNAGNDVLRGGVGDDFLEGGDGADTFIFRDNWDHDVILDFQDNLDIIILQNMGISNADDLSSIASQVGNDIVFAFDAETSLTINDMLLEGVYDDFLF